MAILRQAFNMLARIHSREASLKRLGTIDTYSPCRVVPSNYSRDISAPSQMVVVGREFIIPLDTMIGTVQKLVTFSQVPTDGLFTLTYNGHDTSPVGYSSIAIDVQNVLRLISGLENVSVSGDFTNGFLVAFVGVQTVGTLTGTPDTDFDATIAVSLAANVPWDVSIKRGDKLIDSIFGSLTVKTATEICDLGGAIMGYRVNVE